MCGIFGFTGRREAAPLLLDGLKRLEYRGYDSAGLVTSAGTALHHRTKAGRIAELDRLEKEAGGRALVPEAIIRAFVGASLRMIEDSKCGGRNFIRLLGRTYTDPQKHIRSLIGQLYAPAMARFKSAFERALPQMPGDELVWRMHFMFGTLAYTLAATDTVQLIAGCKPEDRYDARLLEARLTAVLAAGLLAPLHDAGDVKKAA